MCYEAEMSQVVAVDIVEWFISYSTVQYCVMLLWFEFYLTMEVPPPATSSHTTPTPLHFKSVIMNMSVGVV
jgi:hypothetical protein